MTSRSGSLLGAGVLVGIAAAVWIVVTGGPTTRLTKTWQFGFWCLVAAVLLAQIVSRLRSGK